MASTMNRRIAVGPAAKVAIAAMVTLAASCGTRERRSLPTHPSADEKPSASADDPPTIDIVAREYVEECARMVTRQLAARDIQDQRVLDAMQRVPRHAFVPDGLRDRAYSDSPLPIGHRQTISQPYIVAVMTQLVEPTIAQEGLGHRHGIRIPGGGIGGTCQSGLQH